MPDLMLRYRAATLFARLYAPELTMGIHTDDEVIDIVEVAPVVTSPNFAPKGTPAKKATVEAVVVKTPVTPPTPAAVSKKGEVVIQASPEVRAEIEALVAAANAAKASVATPATPEPLPEAPAIDGQGLSADVSDPFEASPTSPEMKALLDAMAKHEVTPEMLIKFSSARNLMKEDAFGKEIETLGLDDIRTNKLSPLTKNILVAGDTLKKIKAS